MTAPENESETEKTTRIGSLMVATVYTVVLGAMIVGGAILALLEKRKGRGR